MIYLSHLSRDPKLRAVLAAQDPVEILPRRNVTLRLCASIMSQQLSTKVAAVLFKRFLELYGGKEPKPQQIVETPFDSLRGIGLSGAKTTYILNVAQFSLEHKLTDKKLQAMPDEELIQLLTGIKGVGRWTVEMLLMFSLGREDVFAPDDYGIQQAMKKLYGWEDLKGKALREAMVNTAEAWRPYRTYACRHLWDWKDSPLSPEGGT